MPLGVAWTRQLSGVRAAFWGVRATSSAVRATSSEVNAAFCGVHAALSGVDVAFSGMRVASGEVDARCSVVVAGNPLSRPSGTLSHEGRGKGSVAHSEQ